MAAEFYGYFDSVVGDERDYDEADLSRGFRVVCDSGVSTLKNDNLKVSPGDGGLRTRIGYGAALVYGFPYELTDDGGAPKVLEHPFATGASRIDRIVLRLDRSSGIRNISLALLMGEEASSPVPPDLTRDGTIYEISLAQCRVGAGVTVFQPSDITDERGNKDVCGNIRHVVTPAEIGAASTAQNEQAIQAAGTAQTTAQQGVQAATGAQTTANTAQTTANAKAQYTLLWSGSWGSEGAENLGVIGMDDYTHIAIVMHGSMDIHRIPVGTTTHLGRIIAETDGSMTYRAARITRTASYGLTLDITRYVRISPAGVITTGTWGSLNPITKIYGVTGIPN